VRSSMRRENRSHDRLSPPVSDLPSQPCRSGWVDVPGVPGPCRAHGRYGPVRVDGGRAVSVRCRLGRHRWRTARYTHHPCEYTNLEFGWSAQRCADCRRWRTLSSAATRPQCLCDELRHRVWMRAANDTLRGRSSA
jgi:hypothetical protein